MISAFYGYNRARFDIVDYAFPLHEFDFYFLIRKNKASDSLQWDIFLSPFDILVWIGLLVIGLFSATFLWLFNKTGAENLSPLMAIWISLASFFGIVIEHESQQLSKRILLFVIFLCGSITFYGYQATITSKLAVIPKEKLPFTNPTEILNTKYEVLSTPKNDFVAQVLLNSKEDSVFGQITKFHSQEENFMDFQKAYEKVAYSNKLYTFFGEKKYTKEICFLKSAWKSPQRSPMSFAFLKHSPLRPFFDRAILKLKEKGVFQQLNQKWKKMTQFPCENETISSSEISIGKVALLLVTLASGVGLSLLILLFEHFNCKT